MQLENASRIICLVLVVLLNGCTSPPPISTTLTDLIAESNDYVVDPLVAFHENVSINGLLLQPQVGAHWYSAKPQSKWLGQSKRSSPAFAIGISERLQDPTFCLYGETTKAVSSDDVNLVRETIETIQARTLQAINATVDLSMKRAALQQVAKDKWFEPASMATQQSALQEQIGKLEERKKELDDQLANDLQTYRKAIKPGIIVARWTVRRSSAASVINGVSDASSSKSKTISGYLVLGGIRISSLYFGDDLRTYINCFKETNTLVDMWDITTYLIQTKVLAYTNAIDLQQALSGALSVRMSSFGKVKDLITDLDKITLTGYVSTAMNLDNTGSLADVQWYKRDRPMVEYLGDVSAAELIEIRDEAKKKGIEDDRDNPHSHRQWVRVKLATTFRLEDSANEEIVDAHSGQKLMDGGWLTVVAVSANAPLLYDLFRQEMRNPHSLPKVVFVGERQYMLIDKHANRTIVSSPSTSK